MNARTPDSFALIIGAMKSGTTSLFEILSQHPSVAASCEKEPEFFSDESVYHRGWAWYTSLWNWDSSRHRVALEASTGYSRAPTRPHVPERIAAAQGAQFKFIYVMRDPADQISSHIRHGLYAGWAPSLDEGIPEYMINIARYAMQIDQYLEYFPRDSLFLVVLEEFRDDPAAILKRLCTFLELAPDYEFRSPGERYNQGNLYEVTPVLARAMKSAPVRAVARTLLPRRAQHWLRRQLPRVARRKASLGRHEMTEQERSALYERLAPDIARLESVHGVPASRYWSFATQRPTPKS